MPRDPLEVPLVNGCVEKILSISQHGIGRTHSHPAWEYGRSFVFVDAFSQSVARLQQASGAAASTLLKVMVNQETPASTRVRAAECIMNHAMKAIELEDIEARVAALEEATRKR